MLCDAGNQYFFFQINCTVEKCSVGTNDTVPDVSGIILSLSITRRTIFQARKMNNSLCIISQYSYEGKVNDPMHPGAIDSDSLKPLSLLHSKSKFEW